MLTKKSNIFVTGHKGLVGSAVIRRLTNHGYKNINTITRNKLDLRDQREVFNFFQKKISLFFNIVNYCLIVANRKKNVSKFFCFGHSRFF